MWTAAGLSLTYRKKIDSAALRGSWVVTGELVTSNPWLYNVSLGVTRH